MITRTIALLTSLHFTVIFSYGNSNVQPSFLYDSNVAHWSAGKTSHHHDILFSLAFYDAKGNPSYMEGKPDADLSRYIGNLDLFHYWEKNQDPRWMVAVTKVAYLVDASPRMFDEKRLSSIEFLREIVGNYQIRPVSPGTYAIGGTLFSPSFSYDLEFIRHPDIPDRYQKGVEYTMNQEPALGTPFLTAVQHNYDYGRVLFHKTTEMSLSITNYYAKGKNRTLVVVYTLNYIHNIPPELIGGEKILVSEIKNMILEYVVRMRKACASDAIKLSMAKPGSPGQILYQ